MPRRPRPPETKRSEHWLRLMVREYPGLLDTAIAEAFGWQAMAIDWRSPIQDDDYAEYYDQAFLDRLLVNDLTMPLDEFWPKSGPRWDGPRTSDDKLILIEAKATLTRPSIIEARHRTMRSAESSSVWTKPRPHSVQAMTPAGMRHSTRWPTASPTSTTWPGSTRGMPTSYSLTLQTRRMFLNRLLMKNGKGLLVLPTSVSD